MDVNCPNCGCTLVNYRTDRQSAGRREVLLRWNICTRCHHVSLQHWAFTDPIPVSVVESLAHRGQASLGT